MLGKPVDRDSQPFPGGAGLFLGVDPRRDVGPDAAVTPEGPRLIEHRLAVGQKMQGAPVPVHELVAEIAEGPAHLEIGQVPAPLLLVHVAAAQFAPRLAKQHFGPDSGDFQETPGEVRKPQVRVHLPDPVGSVFDQVPHARLAVAQRLLCLLALGDLPQKVPRTFHDPRFESCVKSLDPAAGRIYLGGEPCRQHGRDDHRERREDGDRNYVFPVPLERLFLVIGRQHGPDEVFEDELPRHREQEHAQQSEARQREDRPTSHAVGPVLLGVSIFVIPAGIIHKGL